MKFHPATRDSVTLSNSLGTQDPHSIGALHLHDLERTREQAPMGAEIPVQIEGMREITGRVVGYLFLDNGAGDCAVRVQVKGGGFIFVWDRTADGTWTTCPKDSARTGTTRADLFNRYKWLSEPTGEWAEAEARQAYPWEFMTNDVTPSWRASNPQL